VGIDKRTLFCDYYPDEIPAVFSAYAALHGEKRDPQPEEVDVMTFLSM